MRKSARRNTRITRAGHGNGIESGDCHVTPVTIITSTFQVDSTALKQSSKLEGGFAITVTMVYIIIHSLFEDSFGQKLFVHSGM